MANVTRRRKYVDSGGGMFIPMNVEGGTWNEHFITTPKLVTIGCMFAALLFLCSYLASINSSVAGYILWIAVWFFCCIQITRFIIFEEKYYYRMYLELQEHEISTPSLFWNIASMNDTEDGAVMTYSDGKIGIVVKVERDTITGKTKDFEETHYDAISDFYKEVISNRYSFMQMNIMEQAGKDPRLAELSKIVYKSDNENICKLMEMEVGHIKNITHKSLYESDYFLFYTNDITKVDTIIQDITECIFKLLDGAYIGFQILTSKGIVDLVKEIYGVNYFNSTEASLLMFSDEYKATVPPFNIVGLKWTDGNVQELTPAERNRLRNITSGVIKGSINMGDVSLKKAVYRREEKNNIFDDMGIEELKSNIENFSTDIANESSDDDEYIDI